MGDIHKNQEPVARSVSRLGGVRVDHIKSLDPVTRSRTGLVGCGWIT